MPIDRVEHAYLITRTIAIIIVSGVHVSNRTEIYRYLFVLIVGSINYNLGAFIFNLFCRLDRCVMMLLKDMSLRSGEHHAPTKLIIYLLNRYSKF